MAFAIVDETAPTRAADPYADPARVRRWLAGRAIVRAGIPPRFREGFASFEDRGPETTLLKARALEWAEAFDPKARPRGLALVGGTGVGKTHLAAAIACRLAERGFSAAWRNVAELFLRLRSTYRREDGRDEEELLDELIEPDLLVLDDLGVERHTPRLLERLYILLNLRHDACRTLIVTSNYTGRALLERLRSPEASDLADRVISRLAGMVESLGEFPRTDWRKEGWKSRQQK